MSAPSERESLLSSRRGRILSVYMPIWVSGLIVTLLFTIAAHDWSGLQAAVAGAALAFVWTGFVVVPLLMLIATVKVTNV